MKYGRIPGLDKLVSRLVMGVDNQVTWPHASAMFDVFSEQGGNCFDTAFKYGEGRCEEMLGRWMKERGVREQVVIVGKGAHTPYCTDGIHDNLTDEEIVTQLSKGAGTTSARRLVQQAYQRSQQNQRRSKPDDMSAVVILVGWREQTVETKIRRLFAQ